MQTLHFCKDGGYLLGPDRFPPHDPTEFYSGQERTVVGCIRLKCSQCEQLVEVDRNPLPEGQGFRTYRCRDIIHREVGPSRTPDYEDKETYEEALPWTCAGHPAANLPLDLDGVRIARDSDFGQIVRRTLGGWSPEAARPGERESPIGWVVKLYARLLDTGLEDTVSRAVAACIDDPAPRVRSAALEFFAACHGVAGSERVEEFISGDRALFAGVPDPNGSEGHTLEVRLVRALGGRLYPLGPAGQPKSSEALRLVKSEALRSEIASVLYPSLSIVEPGWLAGNAAAIAATGPQAWYWLMITIPDDNFVEAATQLAPLSSVDAAKLRRFVQRRMEEGDPRRNRLLDVLDKRLSARHPPTPPSKR